MEENVIMENKERRGPGVRQTLLFVLLTIPFFQISFLTDTISWMGKAYTACQILAGLVIVFLLFKGRLWKKLPPLFILFAALLFVMCLASAFNGASVKRALEYAFGTLVICLIIEYGILKDLKHFLMGEIIFFGSMTFLNLLSIIFFKNGLYLYLDYYWDTWFLGFKSGHIVFQLALVFFSVMYAVLFDKKKMYIVYIGLGMTALSSFLVKNRTALVILVFLIIFAVVPKILKFTKVFNILTYTGIGIVMNLLFVVMRKQDLFQWLIVGIFHRNMDLTHRVDVWDAAFRAIAEQPVIGHGYQDFVFTPIIVTTHNEILEVLYKAGIIGLVIFLAILAVVIVKLFQARKTEASQWISLFLGIFFLMFVMEQHAFSNFFYLLLFGWHAKELLGMKEEQERKWQEAVLSPKPSPGGGGKSRTFQSARNFLFTMFASITAILIGLIAQKLFISILGLEYAGLNGLFSNVIAILAIVDLGIGEAVVFKLYQPLKDHDEDGVRSLMRFYRKAFHIIAAVIAALGLCLIPFLPYIAKPTEADVNVTLIYLIFLADVVFSYFLSYKRAILYADQKNFYISITHMAYLVGMNIGQLLMLYFTHNYYAYLLIKLLFRILENVVITIIANKKYPYLKKKDVPPLDSEVRADIKKKTGALFFHKIGTFVVNGTDNILISVFFSLTTAGLYNNYYIVIDAATKLFNPAIAALTPSVGNMLVSEDSDHVFQVFRKIRFMNFWIAAFAATALFTLVQPFVSLWFGEEYVLPLLVVIALSFQFFQSLMRGSYNAFQDAAGIFYENRFVPLFESAINLGASILLLHVFGLAGVFMGTIVSSLALWAFSYPRYVYTRLFQRNVKQYALETLGYLAAFLAVCAVTFFAVTGFNRIFSGGGVIRLLADAVISILLSNGLLALLFFRSDCFRYFLDLLKGIVRKTA